jgi:hypothetical protein
MTDQPITQAEIAEHLDMTPRNLNELLTTLGIDWRTTPLDEIRVQYIRRLRSAAAGRSDEKLAVVRARRELADARLKEIELAEKYRMVINVNDIEPLLISLVTLVAVSTVEGANKGIQAIENQHGIKINDDLVHRHIRSALGVIGASGDQLISTLTAKPSASVSSAAQAAGRVDAGQHQAAGAQ